MPTIGVKKRLLDQALGKNYTEEEFDALCFDYGLELDEVTTEKAVAEREGGASEQGGTDEVVYRIDLPANRYDLLCLEGLASALLVFLSKQNIPNYRVCAPSGPKQRLIIDASTQAVRPHCVAAVLRNVTITADAYASFIDLQDKLHQNICRKRSLVAIGTHDLDTIKGPFRYMAKAPCDIRFKPLNQTKELTATQLMELYSTDSHLRHYLGIIRDEPVYPVIYDANGVVLSMPPIINGDHSKITVNTKNVFIEATATDLTKAKVVLDTIVTLFSSYCNQKYTVEPVEVEQADGSVVTYPTLQYRKEKLQVSSINKKVGVDLPAKHMAAILTRMCLASKPVDNDTIEVTIPPTRHDVLHACDVAEDVAIAYGYNNITQSLPEMSTTGAQQPINKLTHQLRIETSMMGFTECLTFALCSRDDVSTKLRNPSAISQAVHIGNPKTLEFQVARTTLIGGILKTISYNKDVPLPLKLFEIQDVVLKDDTRDVCARNERRLCLVYYSKTAGFEVVHGALDRIMMLLGVPFTNNGNGYYIRASNDATFFAGRGAEIVYGNGVVGRLGVIHPEVMAAFDLPALPASALEFNVEPFV